MRFRVQYRVEFLVEGSQSGDRSAGVVNLGCRTGAGFPEKETRLGRTPLSVNLFLTRFTLRARTFPPSTVNEHGQSRCGQTENYGSEVAKLQSPAIFFILLDALPK